jgi:hypothetical protein
MRKSVAKSSELHKQCYRCRFVGCVVLLVGDLHSQRAVLQILDMWLMPPASCTSYSILACIAWFTSGALTVCLLGTDWLT